MIRTSFNDSWAVAPRTGVFGALTGGKPVPIPVTLPHDAIRDLSRSADSDQGAHTGYYPGGAFTYTKAFDIPEEYRQKTVTLEFEGVYRDAMVYINGEFAAQRPNGYTGFAVKADAYLRYGERNTISVDARAHQDSRWYSGAGIYRNVHLLVSDPVHVALDGMRVTTPDIETERAIVAVAVAVENETRATQTVRVQTIIVGADGTAVATESAPVTLLPNATATARARLAVPAPALWSPDDPSLYEARIALLRDDEILDEDRTRFGIRRLQLDPEHGLRINGEAIALRGACIHHDNGLLGAAGIGRAEERRIELLKAAGFNAVRSTHNPISRSLLDACDRLGMLVMDELTDIWTQGKTSFDYSLSFPEWWERDVEAMVAKDFNHPSVILYSIGNEIFEVGSRIGSTWGRRLAEKVRSLDESRFLTNAINPMLAVVDRLEELLGMEDAGTDFNSMMAQLGPMMNQVAASNLVTDAIEESASVLDVVGLNYADGRYELDGSLFPNRVLVGSETFPGHIDQLWRLVEANPHVIGDFTWTGWDYVGEAGIGRIEYTDDPDYVPGGGLQSSFPYLLAGTGDIDITGHRRPMSFYRETVYGLRESPYIAVRRPQGHGRETAQSPWSWTDSVSSWSWSIPVGSPITVDVYSIADEVELLLDGRSLGTTKVGEAKPFLACFETAYEPGELVAVARLAGGRPVRSVLRTANGPVQLGVSADRTTLRADDTDLAYVEILLADADGNVFADRDRVVSVAVSGPGVLAGLGTGHARTEEPFGAVSCTTYDGRAMAIIRPIGEGKITVMVSAEGCEPCGVTVYAGQGARDMVQKA